jgi:hypothetical protein
MRSPPYDHLQHAYLTCDGGAGTDVCAKPQPDRILSYIDSLYGSAAAC